MEALAKLIYSEAWSGLRWEFYYDTNVAKEIWMRWNEIYSTESVYWCYPNPHLRCQIYQGCRFCSLTHSPPTHHCCLLSHLLPFVVFFFSFPFPFSIFLPSSISLHLICWMQKEMPQCFRNPLLTDRNIWLGGKHTGRKIDSGGKNALWNAVLTFSLSFTYSHISLMSLYQASL